MDVRTSGDVQGASTEIAVTEHRGVGPRGIRGHGMVKDGPAGIERIIARIAPEWPDVIEVAAGWYPLLVELDAQLTALAPDYVIYQVKAKFGSLSFYAQPSDDPYDYNQAFQDTIRAAEWKSIDTCEECGQPARQYTITMWTWTLCATHAAEKSG